MKKIVIIGAIIFAVSSCNQTAKEERVLVKGTNDSLLVINIPAASCENCQKVIEDGLYKEKGVKQSILNLNTKQVSIVYAPSITNPFIIEATVNKLATQMPCK
jgi:mercuric ion binding protein